MLLTDNTDCPQSLNHCKQTCGFTTDTVRLFAGSLVTRSGSCFISNDFHFPVPYTLNRFLCNIGYADVFIYGKFPLFK